MSGIGRWSAAIGAMVGTLCWSAGWVGAHPASSEGVRLVFERGAGAESCPSEDEIRAAVVHRLGFDPFDQTGAREIRCTVLRAGNVFRARIEVGARTASPAAEREIVSRRADCGELTAAIELALSIAVRPLSGVVAAPPPTAPSAETPAPAAPPAAAERPPPAQPTAAAIVAPVVAVSAVPPPARPGYEPTIGVDAAGTAGIGPGLAPALGVYIAARKRALSLELGGRFVAPSAADASGGTLTAWLWTASVAPCVHLHDGAFAFCGVGSLGALQAHSDGLTLTEGANVPYLALGARGTFQYPFHPRLRLRAAIELLGPLVRAHLMVDGRDAWVSPRVSGVLGLGVEAIFR